MGRRIQKDHGLAQLRSFSRGLLEGPISRGSEYQTTPHEKQLAVRLNRYKFRPLDFIQTQGIFPSRFSNMKFQQLLFSRLPPHQHEDPMLTPVDAVDLALLDGHSLSIK
jgi:hypothetical protein